MALPFLPYIVVGITHLVAILTGADTVVAVTKPLLMPALLLALLLSLPSRRGETVVLASLGILFGWLGDLSLMDLGPGFVVGLAFFLLGHVAYIVLFVRRMRSRRLPRWWSAAYVPWFAGLLAVLAPHAGALLVPLALYGLALAVLGITGSACSPWIASGAALFVVSDSLLGLDRFLPGFALPQVDLAIMLTYIAAQGLICWGVVRQARATAVVPSLA
ncbi:lysoplasmalogenase [Leifsonia shinshuensis]|uniref:lysoplasmalogenase n=1 Tax=Leifsonia shinshuensis TaxID=150026 RepID=UPI001F5127A5|nr:lysoplasmalogenase [Leifsonia shinshuensis]MCI0158637.1 lysoplasmalogenase [Leifsonia shinshuensis]